MRRHDPKIHRLTSIPVFSGCRADELRRVATLVDEATRPAGEILVHEGAPGDEVMILATGRAHVLRGGATVATLEAGALIGEIALLDGARRTATVVADTDVELLVLDRRALEVLINDVPFVARRLLTAMAQRLRAVAEQPGTVPDPVG